ncbi:MAG TPA: DUF255 domain-containing protein [Bryobacteraceae bacterium]|nr:DUF255 domain-containing protein [Bryobacteraceae bacterium]
MRTRILLLAASAVLTAWGAPTAKKPGAIEWQPWSDAIFDQAKRENKFVLLDLEAVWCHWCHVMDETTYKTPEVIGLIQSKYIPVRVDQDSRPDLSNRYEDYGWPATVIFGPGGGEIVKRQGYIEPRQMIGMLKAVIADPTPGPSVRPEPEMKFPESAVMPADLREELERRYFGQYDAKHGSWGFDQKFLDWTSTEYAMARARTGDAKSGEMARQSLNAQFHLIDRVWGGVYQYSVGGDWNEPHFEKIMNFQAGNLRIYSLAYEESHDPEYLKAAQDVQRFLKTFLTSPEGAFYVSMDADLIEGKHSASYFKLDDAGRRKLGVPRIDKHIYSRENGWAIDAVAMLYAATADAQYLDEATRAARWILENRALDGGGFKHGEQDAGGPYLADTLTMARAFLTLYQVTGDRAWLGRAEVAAKFIQANFAGGQAGFITSKAPTDRSYTPKPERDENILLARFTNLLSHYTGNAEYHGMAERAMRYLAAPMVAKYLPTAGTLLADREISSDPIHMTVVGHKDDPVAQALFHAAAAYPSGYLRLEWWDTREGRLPNPDVQYPELKTAAAFICTGNTCSSPIRDAETVRARADKLTRAAVSKAP